MSTKTSEELLQEIHEDVRDIQTTLKGYDGHYGLCKQVEENTKEIQDNARDIRNAWIAIVTLAAVTGGGAFEIVRRILGG